MRSKPTYECVKVAFVGYPGDRRVLCFRPDYGWVRTSKIVSVKPREKLIETENSFYLVRDESQLTEEVK